MMNYQFLSGFEATILGFNQRKFICTLYDDKVFNRMLLEKIKSILPLAERLYFSKCNLLSDEGLKLARVGKLNSSFAKYKEINSLRKNLKKESILKQLIDAIYYPSFSYVNYKMDKFDEALHLLEKGLNVDEYLISNCEFSILEMHRVQLVNNKMRIYTKIGEKDKAMKVGIDILNMLGANNEKSKTIQLAVPLEKIPNILIRQMFYQVLSELISIFYWDSEINKSLNSLTINLDDFHLAGKWKETYTAIELGNFSDEIFEFLTGDFADCPLLGYSIIYEIYRRISTIEVPLGDRKCAKIKSIVQSVEMIELPKLIENKIEKLPATLCMR